MYFMYILVYIRTKCKLKFCFWKNAFSRTLQCIRDEKEQKEDCDQQSNETNRDVQVERLLVDSDYHVEDIQAIEQEGEQRKDPLADQRSMMEDWVHPAHTDATAQEPEEHKHEHADRPAPVIQMNPLLEQYVGDQISHIESDNHEQKHQMNNTTVFETHLSLTYSQNCFN